MLPVAAPADVGASCALKERLCPAGKVVGKESPLIPNPVPATVARLIVRLELPLFVSLTLCVLLCPTTTFPNVNANGELEASLTTVKLPVTAPADVGAN